MADTLSSSNALIESTAGQISPGGPSSSALLNQLFQGIQKDILRLDEVASSNEVQLARSTALFTAQANSLVVALLDLYSQLPISSDAWSADFFTTAFIGNGTTALVAPAYGQVTLPIRTTQENLVGKDSRGRVWIPPGAQISYAVSESTPAETDWITDSTGDLALDNRKDTAWSRTLDTPGTVWVRVRVPANLSTSKHSNTLILHPSPALSFDLVSAECRLPSGAWQPLDLTYLEGWDSESSKVVSCGMARLFFTPSQVTEIRLQISATDTWGFSHISLQQNEFLPTAALVVDYTDLTDETFASAVLHGKDPNFLSHLSTAITPGQVAVSLVQTAQGTSPVISSVEALL